MKKNKFLKFRNWIEVTVSNAIKNGTGNDLFDWLSLFLLFGGGTALLAIVLKEGIIEFKDFLSAWVLWFTVFVLMRYTKETYYLKKIALKQHITSIRPYLRLQWETTGSLVLVNVGKGVAVDLKFKNENIKFKYVPALSADNGQTKVVILEYANQPEILNPEKNSYQIRIDYQDIEEREYYVVFETNISYNDKFEIMEQKEK